MIFLDKMSYFPTYKGKLTYYLMNLLVKYSMQPFISLINFQMSIQKNLLFYRNIIISAELETLQLNLRQSNIVALSRISSSASKSNNHYLILLWVGRAYVCILLFCQKMRRQRSIISFARVLHLWFPMYCKTYRTYSFEFKLLIYLLHNKAKIFWEVIFQYYI